MSTDQRKGGEFPAEVTRLVDVVGDNGGVDGGNLAALVVFGGVHHFIEGPDGIGRLILEMEQVVIEPEAREAEDGGD